jgi:hypothetical protein
MLVEILPWEGSRVELAEAEDGMDFFTHRSPTPRLQCTFGIHVDFLKAAKGGFF